MKGSKMNRRTALISLLALWIALPGCGQETPNLLRAKRAESRWELVGGPVAYADVGDFVLENDKIRVAILDSGRSWGPGVFGGSLVDADIRRNDDRFAQGQGRDRFAEVFPMAQLLVPAPLGVQVKVHKDGSDEKEAIIRVEGDGYAMIQLLYAVKKNASTLGLLQFKDIKPDVWFRTDYTLRPGESFVRMKTTVRIPETAGESCNDDTDCDKARTCFEDPTTKNKACICKPIDACAVKCDGNGDTPPSYAIDQTSGCFVCPADVGGCSKTLPLNNVDGDEGVIETLLGDSSVMKNKPGFKGNINKGGIGAGDFLFFGKYNQQFVPGNGFDQHKAVWDAWFERRDTFAKPFMFDWVAAVGGDVSYAYYTVKNNPGDPDPKVAVPLFTSTATPFVSATLACKKDASDDAECDDQRLYSYERFLAVGGGDVSSLVQIIGEHRATELGTIKGYVRWRDTGSPAANAHVIVFRDPDPKRDWQAEGLNALITANRGIDGSPGAMNAIDADRGVDPVLDGDFSARLPVGDYVLIALDEHRVVQSDLIATHIDAGSKAIVLPSLPTPARIQIHTIDSGGRQLPAKATVQQLGEDGKPIDYDGGRKVLLGHSRHGSGVHAIEYSADGRFDIPVMPGRYRVIISHGIEYSVHDDNGPKAKDGSAATGFVLKAAQVRKINARLVHEVDTKGWVSGDFHLHQRPSFDSGMPLEQRVRSIVAEGIDYVAATDHDVVTDFSPFVFAANLQNWVKSAIGVEISTLDMGHYIAFPVQYSELTVPAHGAPDWYCMSSNTLMDTVFSRSGFSGKDAGAKPTTIIAHPRDGFLGSAEQMGLDPFSMTRLTASSEADNQIFRTVSCDNDAFEIFNAKRYDLIHTPTVWEIQTYERCTARIDYAGRLSEAGDYDNSKMRAELGGICPELAGMQPDPFAGIDCPKTERMVDCKMRYRRALSLFMNNKILTRTPAEQAAWWNAETDADPEKAAKLNDDRTALCRIAMHTNGATASPEPDPAMLAKPLSEVVKPKDYDQPCPERGGMLQDYLRYLEYGGMNKAALGGSDSHDGHLEPGLPRNYIRSKTDDPALISRAELSQNIRDRKVTATYGPFIDASVHGNGPGETAKVTAGGKTTLKLKVQTASWFGIDRIEVYVNGLLVKELGPQDGIKNDKAALVDFDGTIGLDVPSRDSWVVVVAMGLGAQHAMSPVYLDIPFGELQLPLLASIAFGAIPVAGSAFPRPIAAPDFYPVRPYAISNAILLDTDGNGTYDAPHKRAPFCSPPCDPKTGEVIGEAGVKCADIQSNYVCLDPENRCGLAIPGTCDIYQAITKSALNQPAPARTLP